MAERRMISKKVVLNDDFLALSTSAKSLYLFLVVEADLCIVGWFSSIPGFYLLDASNPLPTHDNHICLKTLPMSPGGQGKEAQNYSQN